MLLNLCVHGAETQKYSCSVSLDMRQPLQRNKNSGSLKLGSKKIKTPLSFFTTIYSVSTNI